MDTAISPCYFRLVQSHKRWQLDWDFRPSDGLGRPRSHTPDSLSSPGELANTIGSPTNSMHQKMRAMGGVPTPFAATSSASPITQRSNPPTPTQGTGRPGEFMGYGAAPFQYPRPHHIPPYYDSYGIPNGEQRRILSEGELMYDRHPQYMMSHDQGPIRELASSPQRGVYMWKDTSPTGPSGAPYFHSNPTSPIQHSLMNNSSNGNGGNPNRSYIHPGGGGGNYYNNVSSPSNYPPSSPSSKKKNLYGMGISATVPNSISDGIRPSPISRRPMSFVRALEMTDSLELSNSRGTSSRGSPAGTPKGHGQETDRSSIYDTNYEISV